MKLIYSLVLLVTVALAKTPQSLPIEKVDQQLTFTILNRVKGHFDKHGTISKVYENVLRPRLKPDERKKLDSVFAKGKMPSAKVQQIYSSLIIQVGSTKHVITVDKAFPEFLISFDGIDISPYRFETSFEWITRVQQDLNQKLVSRTKVPSLLNLFFETAEAFDSESSVVALYAAGIAQVTRSELSTTFLNGEFTGKGEVEIAKLMAIAPDNTLRGEDYDRSYDTRLKAAKFKPLQSVQCTDDGFVTVFSSNKKKFTVSGKQETENDNVIKVHVEGQDKSVHIVESKSSIQFLVCEKGKPLNDKCTAVPANTEAAFLSVNKEVKAAEGPLLKALEKLKATEKVNSAQLKTELKKVCGFLESDSTVSFSEDDKIVLKNCQDLLKKPELTTDEVYRAVGSSYLYDSLRVRSDLENTRKFEDLLGHSRRIHETFSRQTKIPSTCTYSVLQDAKLFSNDSRCRSLLAEDLRKYKTPEEKEFFVAMQNYRSALEKQRREEGAFQYAEALHVAKLLETCCEQESCKKKLSTVRGEQQIKKIEKASR